VDESAWVCEGTSGEGEGGEESGEEEGGWGEGVDREFPVRYHTRHALGDDFLPVDGFSFLPLSALAHALTPHHVVTRTPIPYSMWGADGESLQRKTTVSQVQKSPEGLFIPKELIADFEHVEVDTSHPHAIVIRSPARAQTRETLLVRIAQRRAAIQARRGLLDDSSPLIREDREREERACST